MEIVFIILMASMMQGDIDKNNEQALIKASEAYLVETGVKDHVGRRLDIWKDEHLSPDAQFYGGWAFQISRMAIEKRVVYKWSF